MAKPTYPGPVETSQNGRPPRRLRIALRLYDWSEWCRQVVRGVQGYAHAKPDWELHIKTGPAGVRHVHGAGWEWDGVITAVLGDVTSWRRLLKSNRTKLVAITASIPGPLRAIPSVRIDDSKIAASTGRHLLAGGYRRLAYYSGVVSDAEDCRLAAVRAFAEAEELPLDVFTPRASRSGSTPSPLTVSRWVAGLQKPVGILAWNMDVARKLVEACQRAKAAIPEEVGIVAWDDDVLIAESFLPTISGVVLPAERLGREAAELIDRLMQGHPKPDGPILIEPTGILHVRQSSDASDLPDRDVHLALQYIREHASEPLKVQQIARALRTSRAKLHSEFVRATGKTPHDAITAAHLDRAKQLLLETDWPIEPVAERAGFGTKQTLHRVFLAREGMTPAAYRTRFGRI